MSDKNKALSDQTGIEPVLNSETGKAISQFSLTAQISAREWREVCPDDVN